MNKFIRISGKIILIFLICLTLDFIFLDDYHENYNDKFSIYKKLFFIGNNHFNNKGNQILAEEIINKSKYFKNLLN